MRFTEFEHGDSQHTFLSTTQPANSKAFPVPVNPSPKHTYIQHPILPAPPPIHTYPKEILKEFYEYIFFPSKEELANALLPAIEQYIKSIPTMESTDSSHLAVT